MRFYNYNIEYFFFNSDIKTKFYIKACYIFICILLVTFLKKITSHALFFRDNMPKADNIIKFKQIIFK